MPLTHTSAPPDLYEQHFDASISYTSSLVG